MPGLLAVGRIRYEGGKPIYPQRDGFVTIIVMMRSHSKYWPLSPYYVRTTQGIILENKFQFSKAYPNVPASVQRYSRYDPRIIWQHPAETHIDASGKLTPQYYAWRQKGFACQEAVRYPVGFDARHTCAFSVTDSGERLDYIDSRKAIYLPEYIHGVRKEPLYHELLTMLQTQNLLIVEVDGPHQESVDYYVEKYNASESLIQNHIVNIDYPTLNLFLHDPKHPFGHGYCLAWALYADLRKDFKT